MAALYMERESAISTGRSASERCQASTKRCSGAGRIRPHSTPSNLAVESRDRTACAGLKTHECTIQDQGIA
eukprot:2615088-Rhodomonas_salina.1